MNYEKSEIIALQALAFIAGNEKIMSWMLAETGVDPRNLSHSADNAEILAGVLDFLLAHEEILIDFCAEANLDATSPARARQFMPGAPVEDY
ncbi:DUF3572 domain-containing protein [uncultured Sneathiella sp.]|jgi:hypothetical protein|uniref:DUF3572 domain-containing protein n=1 Tax=uncultured Sneathiella sp. TaxID=879315 RepID=UPI0030D6E59A|tara:strand:+ start:14029 stop:14304 length:276 start_codon:yes stop_codon:yes gene_type:complete